MVAIPFQAALEPLMVDIDLIRPHPDNPNNGDPDMIEESITENTMYRPLYVQRSTGYLIGGNTTYQALLQMGATRAPIIPVDVDDETAMRILIGDNQIARAARMDHAQQLKLLDQLKQTERGLLGTGFDEYTYQQYMERVLAEQDHPFGRAKIPEEEDIPQRDGVECPMCAYFIEGVQRVE